MSKISGLTNFYNIAFFKTPANAGVFICMIWIKQPKKKLGNRKYPNRIF